jgi:hypothetical protein
MSKPEPRSYSALREIEFHLRPFMQSEAVEILARAMARTMARDLRQSHQLTELFKTAFIQEQEYLVQLRTRERAKSGGLS